MEKKPITLGELINMLEYHNRDLPLCISIGSGEPKYLPNEIDYAYDISADGLHFLHIAFI